MRQGAATSTTFIVVDDGRCSCHTEQGTKYEVDAGVCRAIARDGVYNPFRKPLERAAPRSGQQGGQGRGEGAPKDQQATVAAADGGYWPKPTIPQDYSPPEHQIVTGMN